jgi:hypothetical protein
LVNAHLERDMEMVTNKSVGARRGGGMIRLPPASDLFLLQNGPGMVFVVAAVQVIDVECAVVVSNGFVPAERQLITLHKREKCHARSKCTPSAT